MRWEQLKCNKLSEGFMDDTYSKVLFIVYEQLWSDKIKCSGFLGRFYEIRPFMWFKMEFSLCGKIINLINN